MSDPITVRRRRSSHFAAVPHHLARDSSVSDKALRCWLVLQCYADWSDRDAYPSLATLAVDMGCTTRTVQRALDELVDRHLVEIEARPGTSNLYTVIDPPEPVTHDTHVVTPTTPVSGVPTTPMSPEQDPGDLDPGQQAPPVLVTVTSTSAKDLDPLLGFQPFWDAYPKRHGKRLGRGKCEVRWAKYDLDTRRAAYRGAKYYGEAVAAGLTIAADPDRWLRDKRWEDWQEPATPDGGRDPLRRAGQPSLSDLLNRANGG